MNEKTKGLIAQLNLHANRGDGPVGDWPECCDAPEWTCCSKELLRQAAAALAAQAQEIVQQGTKFDEIMKRSGEMGRRMLALLQRAEAAEAEVKRITQMAIGSIYAEWERRVEGAEARVRELGAQLPAEMKDCTIRFKECEKGHGRLTADNWVDRGCHWCELDAIEAKTIGRAEEAVRACAAFDENGYICEKAKAITSIRALAKNPNET